MFGCSTSQGISDGEDSEESEAGIAKQIRSAEGVEEGAESDAEEPTREVWVKVTAQITADETVNMISKEVRFAIHQR